MKKIGSNMKRIVVATTVSIFSLATAVMGTYAWFMKDNSVSTSASKFAVTSLDASIASVTLYKFNYASDGYGGYEYLFPELGWVGAYEYDDSVGRKCFGEVVNGVWTPVTTMNLYDPLNGTITGRGLLGMNCNAIFKITLSSTGIYNSTSTLTAKASSIQSERSKESDDIWLSSCVDFDLFLPSALSDPRLVTDGYKNYLPDESDDYLPQNYVFSNQYEEDYYKISYLASLKDSHAHLYGSSDPVVDIGSDTVTFVNGLTTVYINVNYAPDQLTRFESTVTPDDTVKAIYDFLLEISL